MAGGNWLFNLMYFFLAVYPFALDFDVLYIRKKKKKHHNLQAETLRSWCISLYPAKQQQKQTEN